MRDLMKRKVRPCHTIGKLFLQTEGHTLSPMEIENHFQTLAANGDEGAKRILGVMYRLPTFIWNLENSTVPEDVASIEDSEAHPDHRYIPYFATEKHGKTVVRYTLRNPKTLNAKGQVKCLAEHHMDEIVAGLMDSNPNNDDRAGYSDSGEEVPVTEILELTNDEVQETILEVSDEVTSRLVEQVPEIVEEVIAEFSADDDEHGLSVSDMTDDEPEENSEDQTGPEQLDISEPVVDDDTSQDAILDRNAKRRAQRAAAKAAKQSEAA